MFLSDSHMEELASYLSKFSLNNRLRMGEITLDQYREESAYCSQTSIIDKSNVRRV
jgi:hypothetical protein